MSDTHDDMLKKFKTFLEQDEKPSTPGGTTTAARLAKMELWREMRKLLAVNDSSVGLRVLDDMAAALINERGRAAATLDTPVIILPLPSKMASTVGVLSHPDFADAVVPAGAVAAPAAAVPAAVPQKRASSGTPAKGSKSKKPRSSTGSAKLSMSDSGSSTETTLSMLDFELSPDTPADVRQAIETIYAKAEAAKRTLYQLAYPWEDIPLWYDPEDYPGVHVAHWRLWNAFRATFFEWALHAPLSSSSAQAQAQRRKRKMAAIRERLCFLSLCIETWGYYNFLRCLEAKGNSDLMWWGGQSGRRTPEAKGYTCSPIRDLLDLYENEPAEYRRKVRDALKPFQLDAGSFKTMTELLVKTDALDPDLAENDKRLSDTALARIIVDITRPVAVPKHWVPTVTEGVWRKLLDNTRLSDLALKISRQLQTDKYDGPLVPDYNPKESRIKGFTPFMCQDGTPTAAGPATEVDDDDPKYCQTPDEEVADALADAEAKDAAKSAALEAAFAEEEEEEDEEEDDATQKSADEDEDED
ncbi:hypothetical protein PF007_g11004 [Phytophthora fragariae]|uniref:Uncharacterized protein n=1 Tax=Phytophthora fragariae TaxID=53985 RepID=A0A6A3SIL4_9STRA|nr:hypothetical protein PF003_g9758 [Phytophthora fragariae]KAE9112709.1 hypothetical protein PF007_g11004 [Phytophthora fragariae]KAE9144991.1 hypothetical protein PF006_g10125 [Phytophthora fragariae]KAE9310803.1 hypothetical protein PF001_g10020 [Phytophthora fragariae]